MRIQKTVGAALLAVVLFATAFSAVSADNNDNQHECSKKKRRGCEVPEVPYSAILPAATMAGITGFYVVQRRRHTRVSVEADEAK